MPGEIDYALHQIDRFLENYDLPEDDVGILLDIHVDDPRTTRIEANVRYLGFDRAADYSYDMSFRYEETDSNRIIEEVYPEWVEQLEERYSDARIEYPDPGQSDGL